MTLTATEVEQVSRVIARLKRLNNEKSSVQYIRPVLNPTIESEINDIKNQIIVWIQTHPNRTREEYIAAIKPLKDLLAQKIIDNENIITSNNLLIQQATSQYNTDVKVVQDKIDALENVIKTYLINLNAKLD